MCKEYTLFNLIYSFYFLYQRICHEQNTLRYSVHELYQYIHIAAQQLHLWHINDIQRHINDIQRHINDIQRHIPYSCTAAIILCGGTRIITAAAQL